MKLKSLERIGMDGVEKPCGNHEFFFPPPARPEIEEKKKKYPMYEY
jgi:hypothetical protein